MTNMNPERAINNTIQFHKSAIDSARQWASQFKKDSSTALFEEFLADLEVTLTEMREDYNEETGLSGDSK